MKREGFTLIELIFVIVIIGVLAAVAVPKFQNLRASAQVNNLFKILRDAQSSVSATYVNLVDLEGYDNNITNINDFVNLNGEGWHHATSQGSSWMWYGEGTSEGTSIARIVLHNKPTGAYQRTLEIEVICGNFKSKIAQKKCVKKTGESDMNKKYKEYISW